MKRILTSLFVVGICFVSGMAIAAEKKAADSDSQKKDVPAKISKKDKEKNVYEFKITSPSFGLYFVDRELDLIKERIRTANEWIPGLVKKEAKTDPNKVLLKLRERQASLKKKRKEYVKQAAKSKSIFQRPYYQKGEILQRKRDTLASILQQAAQARGSALTAECPEDFYMYSSVNATEFREYKSTATEAGTNTFSEWIFKHGTSATSITGADTLRFEASAFPIPGFFGESLNSIMTAGLLKFNFPIAPCDVVIEWNAVVNIDFILGARIDGENDGIMVDLVLREQPESTSFPNAGLDDAGFQWVDWGDIDFCDPGASGCPGLPNSQRRTKRVRLSGQMNVNGGMNSSLIMGPSLNVMGWSEWASVGLQDNPWDDGAFFFHGIADDCYYGTPCGPQDMSIEFLMRPR
jgi:hypothetical protein